MYTGLYSMCVHTVLIHCAVYNYVLYSTVHVLYTCTQPVNELKLEVESYNLAPGHPEHLGTPEVDTPLTGTACAF